MFILVAISSIITALVTWWYYQYFKLNKYYTKYNGPKAYPIIGSAYHFKSDEAMIITLMRLVRQFGTVINVWIGYRPRIIIADHRVAEQLLGSTTILDKPYEYEYFHPWLGTGLLTSTGAKWKRQRKLITPTFHFKILEQFINIFNVQGEIMIKRLKEKVDAGPFDIYPYVNMYTLDVICEAAMGTELKAQSGGQSKYVKSVAETTKLIMLRTVSLIKGYHTLYKLTPDYWKQKKALEILHGHTNSVIASRQKELEGIDPNAEEKEDSFGIKKRMAFLDLLLQCRIDGEPLPTDVIREEVDTFMFEGHDTTTSAISSILFLLSKNRDVQDKIVEELQHVFMNDKFRHPTYQDLMDMKYLDMVVKEALRLFPPIPIFARSLSEDAHFDGKFLPKDTTLVLFAYGLHRNEEVFPDAEKFDPERFTPENSAKRSPYAYVPFSAGPRNCIGLRFAMLELKSAVAEVLRHYELFSVDGFDREFRTDVIIRSFTGTKVQLRKRAF